FLPRAPTRTSSSAARSRAAAASLRSAACSRSTSVSTTASVLMVRDPSRQAKRGHPAPSASRECCRSTRERGLGPLGQAGKARLVVHRQIGQDLAVDLDARGLEAVNHLAVGEAHLARRRIDALNPERAEIALSVAPVAVGVLQPLLDPAQRQPETVLAPPPVALGLGDDFLVPRLGGDSTLDPCHASSPELR